MSFREKRFFGWEKYAEEKKKNPVDTVYVDTRLSVETANFDNSHVHTNYSNYFFFFIINFLFSVKRKTETALFRYSRISLAVAKK